MIPISFLLIISLFFVFFFLFVFINFYKNYFIYLIFFFHENYENYFYFSMFRDAPVCSGMFRVLSTPLFTLLSIASSPYQVSLISRTNVFNSSKYTTMIHVQLFQRPVNNSKSIFCSQLVEDDIVNVL